VEKKQHVNHRRRKQQSDHCFCFLKKNVTHTRYVRILLSMSVRLLIDKTYLLHLPLYKLKTSI